MRVGDGTMECIILPEGSEMFEVTDPWDPKQGWVTPGLRESIARFESPLAFSYQPLRDSCDVSFRVKVTRGTI